MKCIQSKHLQDNYEYWIGQLREIKHAPSVAETVASPLTVPQVALEEIVETEVESEQSNELAA